MFHDHYVFCLSSVSNSAQMYFSVSALLACSCFMTKMSVKVIKSIVHFTEISALYSLGSTS